MKESYNDAKKFDLIQQNEKYFLKTKSLKLGPSTCLKVCQSIVEIQPS